MGNIHVALLRGINVGRNKRVAMADLRTIVEDLGYGNVRTLLNSGNVVFDSGRAGANGLAARIEKAMAAALDVSARVMVLSAGELADVIAANPLTEIADNPSRLLVGILAAPADAEKLDAIAREDWGKERIALGASQKGAGRARRPEGGAARAVYLWLPDRVIESPLNNAFSKALGDSVTTRNWSTMLKLKEMAGAGA